MIRLSTTRLAAKSTLDEILSEEDDLCLLDVHP